MAPALSRRFIPALLAALALYLGAGVAILSWWHPEGLGAGEILSLVVPAPILALVFAWFWLEKSLGRRLVPIVRALPGPRSPAWRHTERRATLLLACISGFFSLSPIGFALMHDKGLDLTSLAPIMTWLWILRTFGLDRMRTSLIYVFAIGQDTDGATYQDRARELLTGYVLETRKSDAAKWTFEIKVDNSHLVPVLDAKIQSLPDPDKDADHWPEVLSLSREDARVLMTWITGDANPYSLVHFFKGHSTIDLSPLSAHEKFAAIKDLFDARAQTAALFPSTPASEQDTAQ